MGEVMRSAIVWLFALAISSVAVLEAQTPYRSPTQFTNKASILRWFNGYRTQPDADRLPEMVQAASAIGLFRDMETAGVYVGFVAGVIETNPKKAEALIAKMFPLPPEDQVAVVRAIAHSGHPQWKELLAKFSERMPARRVLIDRFITGKQPTFKQMALDTGAVPLDMLW